MTYQIHIYKILTKMLSERLTKRVYQNLYKSLLRSSRSQNVQQFLSVNRIPITDFLLDIRSELNSNSCPFRCIQYPDEMVETIRWAFRKPIHHPIHLRSESAFLALRAIRDLGLTIEDDEPMVGRKETKKTIDI